MLKLTTNKIPTVYAVGIFILIFPSRIGGGRFRRAALNCRRRLNECAGLYALNLTYKRPYRKNDYADGNCYCNIGEHKRVVAEAVRPDVVQRGIFRKREHARKHVRGKAQNGGNDCAQSELYLRKFFKFFYFFPQLPFL